MKNLMERSICLIAFISLLGLTSCDKELDKEVSLQNKYITYQSYDDYSNKMNEIIHMTQEERANYEISNGYISFGRYCDELYSSIDFEQFKSQEEIIAFVNKNSDYLKLTDEGNGEYTLDVVYDDKFSRYMYGLDKIFIIADTAYKTLDTKFIACSSNNVEELSKITEDNYTSYTNDSKYKVFDSKPTNYTTKDVATNNGTFLRRIEEDGRNQTRSYGIIEFGPPIINGRARCTSGAKVRPYNRTLGVWYYCSRTLDLNTKFFTHYKIGSTWYEDTEYTNSTYGVYASVLIFSRELSYNVDDAHFGKVYVYGDSPDTEAAIINYY